MKVSAPKDLTKGEISDARQLAAAIVNAAAKPTGLKIEAIELDNWVSGDSPMPAGGARDVRHRIRKLRSALVTSGKRRETQQPLTAVQK